MNKIILGFVILLAVPLFSYAQNSSDHMLKEQIIKESIARYSGNCPCPYNLAKNGSRCGKRSAYSKPGGYSLKCYVEDISQQDIQAWKQRNKV